LFGILAAVGSIVTAFRGKLRPTVSQLALTMIAMVITRDSVRTLQLEPYFTTAKLTVAPQYDVMVLFLIVLLAGLACIGYMLHLAFPKSTAGGSQ